MKKAVLLLFLILTSLNLIAMESLTIEKAISIALNFNPEIKKSSERIRGAEGRKMQLEAYTNPEIVFSREGLYRDKAEMETSFGIFQTIEFLGKRKLRKDIGQIEEEIARMELEKVKRIVISKVKKAYFKSAFYQEEIKLLGDIERSIEDYVEGATLKYQAGEVSFADVLRGRIELLRLKNEIINAKKELKEGLRELGKIIGLRLDGDVKLISSLQFEPFHENIEELLEKYRFFPSIKIEEFKLQVSAKEIELSQKSFYPDLRVGFFYPSLRAGAWGFEFGFSIPVFQKGLKGALVKADSNKVENQISVEAKKREISSKLESLYSNLKSSEEIIKNYEQSIFPELEDLFSSSLSYYQSGVISALEFFDILRTFKTTKIDYKKEILNYIYLIADIESAGEED